MSTPEKDYELDHLIDLLDRYSLETPIDPEKIGLVAKLILFRQKELAKHAKWIAPRKYFNPDDTTRTEED